MTLPQAQKAVLKAYAKGNADQFLNGLNKTLRNISALKRRDSNSLLNSRALSTIGSWVTTDLNNPQASHLPSAGDVVQAKNRLLALKPRDNTKVVPALQALYDALLTMSREARSAKSMATAEKAVLKTARKYL